MLKQIKKDETRLEMADDWYFAGLTDIDVDGCFARLA